MKRVAVLTYNHAAIFELGCALELFALPRPEFEHWYQCEVVTFDEGVLEFLAGVSLSARKVTNLDDFQILVIPSWSVNGEPIPEPMATEIKKFYHNGHRVISFCSGSFLLVHLGLMDGQRATTHWRYAHRFAALFSTVEYVDDVLYLYDGRIGCSAGSSAAIDLGIEVIRQDYGSAIANKVARRMVLSAHRKGEQTQFAEYPLEANKGQLTEAMDWAVKNTDSIYEVGQLAKRANMSRRSFDRKFKANYNITPKHWLTFQRLNLAKEYLENYDYSVEKVAELTGFGNATTMPNHFRTELDTSPTAHREKFTCKKEEF